MDPPDDSNDNSRDSDETVSIENLETSQPLPKLGVSMPEQKYSQNNLEFMIETTIPFGL